MVSDECLVMSVVKTLAWTLWQLESHNKETSPDGWLCWNWPRWLTTAGCSSEMILSTIVSERQSEIASISGPLLALYYLLYIWTYYCFMIETKKNLLKNFPFYMFLSVAYCTTVQISEERMSAKILPLWAHELKFQSHVSLY